MKKKRTFKWWIIPIVIVMVVGGLFGYNYYTVRAQQQTIANLQTATVVQGNIANYVDATGAVRTNQSAVLSWQAGGTAGQIKVKVGDQVKAGQVLASLDSNSLPTSIITAQSDLIAAQQALQTLQTSNTATAQAYVNLINAQKTYSNTLTTQQNLNDLSSSQAYVNAQNQLMRAQGLVDQLQKSYQGMAGDPNTNPAKAQAKFNLNIAIGKRDQAQNQVDLLSGQPTQQQLDLAQANTDLAKSQLADAQRAWNQVQNGPAAQDILSDQAKIQAAQATLNQANVVAPFSGTITQVNVQAGDVVKSGDSAFQIDDVSGLFVDLQVSEVDINKVQVGQPVNMTLDAIPNATYNGKVVTIGQVATTTNGAVYYMVTVQFTNAGAKVKPGMTASASIVVEQKTGVLLVPSLAIRTVNNRSFVEVKNGTAFRRELVTTGLTSDTDTEVTSQTLKAGDNVVLNPQSIASSFRGAGIFGGGLFRIFGGGGGGANFRTGGGNFGGGGNFNGGNRTGGNGGGNSGGSNAGGSNP